MQLLFLDIDEFPNYVSIISYLNERYDVMTPHHAFGLFLSGRQCKFDDFDATILESKDSNSDGKSYIIQNPCVARLDTNSGVAATTVSTAPILRSDRGMQHVEGGWPSEVDVDDPGALERFRKKREKGTMTKSGTVIEPLGKSVKELSPGLVSAVKQNNTIDIYEEYFSGYSTCHCTFDF